MPRVTVAVGDVSAWPGWVSFASEDASPFPVATVASGALCCAVYARSRASRLN